MKRWMRELVKVTGRSAYGPHKVNPEYAVTDKNGVCWRLRRHHWSIPTASWAWKAEAAGQKTIYEDTLEDMLATLGFEEEVGL